jgi:hypothetical protein
MVTRLEQGFLGLNGRLIFLGQETVFISQTTSSSNLREEYRLDLWWQVLNDTVFYLQIANIELLDLYFAVKFMWPV